MSTQDLDALPLRQRKRLVAMRRIQTVALDLFERDGFDAVTVEQIATAAEVSPSSIYRWFGTKESLVIWDEYDPAALAAIEQRLRTGSTVDALGEVVRASMGTAFDADPERIKLRLRLAYAHPSIEAASALQAYEMAGMIAGLLARARGDDIDALDLQVAAHGFVGALLGALRHWHDTDFTTPVEDIAARPTALLARGLDLA
jgi:AcrR family transcriptional regulator